MSSTLSSVRKALEVLHLLRRRGPLRLSEIAAELGIGTSTAHRLLTTLREERFVRQEVDGKRYELGPAMLYATSASAMEHCVGVSAPIMQRLRQETDETVHLSILRGAETLFAAAVEPSKMVRVSSRVGQHPPAHTTAAGKVLLAALAPERVLELYPTTGLRALTDRTITTRDGLLEELSRARADGYARNVGESETEMYAIAVPLSRPGGEVAYSLSIAAPSARVAATPTGELQPVEQDYLVALRDAAHEIETHLAF